MVTQTKTKKKKKKIKDKNNPYGYKNRFPRSMSLSTEAIQYLTDMTQKGTPEQKYGFKSMGFSVEYLINKYKSNGGKVNVKAS